MTNSSKSRKTCAVDLCPNNGATVCPKTGKKIVYHQFPADPILRKLWIRSCTVPNPIDENDLSQLTICSAHFKSSDYKRSFFKFKESRLKETAYPTVGLNEGSAVHQEFYLRKRHYLYTNHLSFNVRHRQKQRIHQQQTNPHKPTKIMWNEEVTVVVMDGDQTFFLKKKLSDRPKECLKKLKSGYQGKRETQIIVWIPHGDSY